MINKDDTSTEEAVFCLRAHTHTLTASPPVLRLSYRARSMLIFTYITSRHFASGSRRSCCVRQQGGLLRVMLTQEKRTP